MGNSTIRVDNLNMTEKRKHMSSSYDTVRGVEDTCIWEQLEPINLALNSAFSLIGWKEFKNIKLDNSIQGFGNKYKATQNLIELNKLDHLYNKIKLKNPSVFQERANVLLREGLNSARQAGNISSQRLAELNKQYTELLKSSLGKRAYVQKGILNLTKFSPSLGTNLLKNYKYFKFGMIMNEAFLEWSDLTGAFKLPNKNGVSQGVNWDTGLKQVPKSLGRMAVGGAGYLAAAAAGAKIGAAIGSLVPGAGTFVGGLLGSVVGFACGSVGSQIARMGYDSVVKSEVQIAKDDTIDKFLDPTDKSTQTIAALEKEINESANFVGECDKMMAEITDEDEKAVLLSKKANVMSNIALLQDAYKQKLGKEYVAMSSSGDAEMQQTTMTPATQTVNENTLAQNASRTTSPAFNPMFTGGYPSFNNGYNFNPMMQTPLTDWSMMLPMDLQRSLFYVS